MKRPTIFIDLDGLLIPHEGAPSVQWFKEHGSTYPVNGALELLDELEKAGCCVVITTARKECVREETEALLKGLRFHYDQLVMSIGSGCRFVLNDSKPKTGEATCYAWTLKRNEPLDVAHIIEYIEDKNRRLS